MFLVSFIWLPPVLPLNLAILHIRMGWRHVVFFCLLAFHAGVHNIWEFQNFQLWVKYPFNWTPAKANRESSENNFSTKKSPQCSGSQLFPLFPLHHLLGLLRTPCRSGFLPLPQPIGSQESSCKSFLLEAAKMDSQGFRTEIPTIHLPWR